MKTNDLKRALAITSVLFMLAALSCALSYLHQINVLKATWMGYFFPVMTSLFIVLTDIYMMVKSKGIVRKKAGILYLGLGSFVVIGFQVMCDLLLQNPTGNWQRLLFDAMFNVSFCMLFIVTFNFADVYTLKLTRTMSE